MRKGARRRKNGREGGDGGEIEDSASLDGRFVHCGDFVDLGGIGRFNKVLWWGGWEGEEW